MRLGLFSSATKIPSVCPVMTSLAGFEVLVFTSFMLLGYNKMHSMYHFTSIIKIFLVQIHALYCSLVYVPLGLIAGVLGAMVDLPVISVIALCKSFYMLFKGWHRLFHDCIGREGPFLETICVPFAGLAILLWPLAVVGAVLGSMVSSIFLGAYAAVIVYKVDFRLLTS